MFERDAQIGRELADRGTVILLETRGRISGLPRETAVGFVEQPDGSLWVAAGSPETQWARNLLADRRCSVICRGQRSERIATALEDSAKGAAIVALILKYGTPSERLGRGPAFELRVIEPER